MKPAATVQCFVICDLDQATIPAADLPRLYRGSDCFAIATRGEGWCRPLWEAMAAGLPTIATDWSGLTAFHNSRTGYPLAYRLQLVSESRVHESGIYAGQRWAEPEVDDLRRLLRHVVTHKADAQRKAKSGQRFVTANFSRGAVTELLRKELAFCRTS